MEPKNWLLFVQAITFAIAMRGPLDARGVVVNLKPYVEEFEAQMVIDWGLKNGLYEESALRCGFYSTTEWWWLSVPPASTNACCTAPLTTSYSTSGVSLVWRKAKVKYRHAPPW